MKKILYILGLLLVLATHEAYALDCHMRELDLCAATLLLFNQGESVAQSESELDTQCQYIRDAELCLRNYTNNCMTPIQKELIKFVGEGSETLLSEYCTAGTEIRSRYLQNAACLNDANKETRTCLEDLQVALQTISEAKFDKRVPTACCGYQRYMACVREKIESKCGKESVDFMQELLRMAVSRLPDIICTGYGPNNDECTTLLPDEGTPPKEGSSDSALSRIFSAYFSS
ncbi:uncharacterized protein LOC106459752 [Limulus polyphemus]|uniref:Uncharacterized protein LOC106459752 n=1 Tax=Limulus polyphemus TaxID=6850 RepID=A0ABM1B4U7_LIMPO|nr:uncharacterized protein LOC106459752 [Limulus polyphemus]